MHSPIKIQQTLKHLNFSNNEVKVLLFLFYAKKATAQTISFQTGISFSSTQYCLSNLLSLEIIHSIPNKENCFEIVSRNEFCEWIEKARKEQQKMYEKSKDKIQGFLTKLKTEVNRPGMKLYVDKSGIINIYESIINSNPNKQKKGTIYSLQDIHTLKNVFGNYVDDYVQRRKKENIFSYAIMPKNETNLEYAKQSGRNSKLLSNFENKEQLKIYGEKAAFITFKRKIPVGFVFEGKFITDTLKSAFDCTWNFNNL